MNDLWPIGVENWCMVCQDQERWSNVCTMAVDEVAQCRERNNCVANRCSRRGTL